MQVAGGIEAGAGPYSLVVTFGPGMTDHSGLLAGNRDSVGTLNSAYTEPGEAPVYAAGFGGFTTYVRPPAPSTTVLVSDIISNSCGLIQRPTRVRLLPPAR